MIGSHVNSFHAQLCEQHLISRVQYNHCNHIQTQYVTAILLYGGELHTLPNLDNNNIIIVM